MKSEPVEGLGARPLHLELDPVALLRRLDLESVDDFPRRAPLLDVDGDVGLVPGLDLDRAVKGREVEFGRAGRADLEAFLVTDDLALRVDADDAGGAECGQGQDRGRGAKK